jgi:alkylation response protein AidB-like acyl-CoA dehydrogenase
MTTSPANAEEALSSNSTKEPDNETFRQELREWLQEHVVGEFASIPGIGYGSDDRYPEIRIAWEKELVKGGWLGLTWPVKYGGRGFSIVKEIIFLEEITRARAPKWFGGPGRDLLAPMLLEFGTEEQKKRFLPGIMSAEQLWGQGFSEPGAGSDLASVSTRAERDGNQWIINGQKMWMTFGHYADWVFMLCRTDPNASTKHRGLTMLLVDASQSGVDIRPIRAITGTNEFAEAFFTDAVTSDDLVLGGVNQGWRVAMSTVAWERALTMLPYEINFEHLIGQLIEFVRVSGRANDAVVRDRIAQSWINLKALRINTQRTLDHLGAHG